MTLMKPAVLLCALTAFLFAASPAHATFLTVNGVDSSDGGFMNIISASSSFDSGTQNYTIHLTAKETSATESYQGVGLALQFIYPADGSNVTNGNGFNYLGGGTWENAADTEEFQFVSVTPYSSVSQSMSRALTDIPQNGTSGSFTAGPLSTGDSIPMVQLGDFAPLQSSSDFALTFHAILGGGPRFNVGASFVAVPEPSSLILAALGGIGLLMSIRRRRCLAR